MPKNVRHYGFTGDGDAPDLTNRLTSRFLPGRVLYTTKLGSDGAFTPSYDHSSVRGDLVLTTDAAGHQAGTLRTLRDRDGDGSARAEGDWQADGEDVEPSLG